MKKLLCLVILNLIVILSSCDPFEFYFKRDEYIDEIVKIELVKYNNNQYQMIDPEKVVLKFDSAKVESIEVLDEEKKFDFLSEFEQIVFHEENESVDEPIGYCLLWHLQNGNFIVFSCTLIKDDRAYGMCAEFDSSYNFVQHLADFAARPHFENVLKKYFKNYQI